MSANEKVKVALADDWFDGLIESLLVVEKYLVFASERHPGKGWERDLRINRELRDKLIKYGQYYESESGQKRMRADLFRSNAEELIWQLVLAATLFIDLPKDSHHYDEYKKRHEEFVAQYEKK